MACSPWKITRINQLKVISEALLRFPSQTRKHELHYCSMEQFILWRRTRKIGEEIQTDCYRGCFFTLHYFFILYRWWISDICNDLIQTQRRDRLAELRRRRETSKFLAFDILIPREILVFIPSRFHDETTFHRDDLSVEFPCAMCRLVAYLGAI